MARLSSPLRSFAIIAASIAIAACAADGTFAGKGKPVDIPATVAASCATVQASDAQFQTFAKAHPGKIDSNGMDTEGSIVNSFFSRSPDGLLTPQLGGVCDPKAKVNLAAAETSLLSAVLQIANLLATWSK